MAPITPCFMAYKFPFVVFLIASSSSSFPLSSRSPPSSWSSRSSHSGNSHSSDGASDNDTPLVVVVSSTKQWSQTESRHILQEHVLPATEYTRRIQLGRQSQGVARKDDDEDSSWSVIRGQDPRLACTYGEFPLDSLDRLLDRALQEIQTTTTTTTTVEGSETTIPSTTTMRTESSSSPPPLTVIDLGSGCGRLAIYMALTRSNWHVHGIEVSPLLHQQALEAQERAIQGCWLQRRQEEEEEEVVAAKNLADGDSTTMLTREDATLVDTTSRLFLHLGPASDFSHLIQQADLILCYSTAFESSGFSEQTSTLLLGTEWNDLLTRHCTNRDCVVITTDKSLDPSYGWSILDRINVPNPEVVVSTGFIHQLRK